MKIFGLLDDKSRLISYLRAGFHERQEDFLRVLFEAVRRRGVPRSLLLDNRKRPEASCAWRGLCPAT